MSPQTGASASKMNNSVPPKRAGHEKHAEVSVYLPGIELSAEIAALLYSIMQCSKQCILKHLEHVYLQVFRHKSSRYHDKVLFLRML